jgi:hypothetical protein
LASIEGVSNPGGNVDLVPGTGINITPDQTNRRITIAASGTQGLVSVGGVSNPGGNIDLVQAQAITITPNDTTNQITIGESHSTLTNNPHNVTASQIGALLASDYDLRQRALGFISFSNGDANGATRTVNVGFQPRIVLVVGDCRATLGNRTYGGIASAFADLEGGTPGIQKGFRFGVVKNSNTDWFCQSFVGDGLGGGVFQNAEVTPNQHESLLISVSNVSATGLTATLVRTIVGPNNNPLTFFNIVLHLLCMG